MNRREFLRIGAGAGAAMATAGMNLGREDKKQAAMLARELDPCLLMRDLGLTPDPWQGRLLRDRSKRLQVLCCRQAGKSTTTAIKALHTALFEAGSLVLLVSPTLRQSGELFKKVAGFYEDLKKPEPPVIAVQETALTMTLENRSRIVSLPGSPDTIRGFSGPKLVVIDEAAMTSDALLTAVTPMLAVGGGRLIAISTPKGKRGWFHEQWEAESRAWARIMATADDCPRITKEFIETERETIGDREVRQEYFCSFEEMIGQYLSTDSINAAFDSNLGIDLSEFLA